MNAKQKIIVGTLAACFMAVGSAPAYSSETTRVHPNICNDRAPDYLGCTAAQVRTLSTAETRNEYSNRYYGSRGPGRIWGGLTNAQHDKIVRMYDAAVARIGKAQQGEAVTNNLMFQYFSGYAPNTVSACTVWAVLGMPYRYCNTGTDPNDVHSLGDFIDRSDHVVFACNGTMLGGVVAGVGTTWWTGAGTVGAGAVGALGGELACQTSNLYDAMTGWFG